VHVNGVIASISAADLHHHFAKFGPTVQVKRYRTNGYARVTFLREADAEACVKALKGAGGLKVEGSDRLLSVSGVQESGRGHTKGTSGHGA
jgi:hypothetical protein